MSTFKLTKDGKGLMKYSNDSLTAQKEIQYSDRASKQLAEDVFAKNRADHDSTRSKAPKSINEREQDTKSRKLPKETAELQVEKNQTKRNDRWSLVDIPLSVHNAVQAPFIHDYYDAGSPSLREYIERSYLPWKQVLGVQREAMEAKLKALLDRVKVQGTIEYLEWGALPLPQEVVYRERARGETGLVFEDVVGYVRGAKQMDEELREEEQRKLRDACERKERELEVLTEELKRKERAVRESR
jgi:hypothetical protein